jgi:hypothetical protein
VQVHQAPEDTARRGAKALSHSVTKKKASHEATKPQRHKEESISQSRKERKDL